MRRTAGRGVRRWALAAVVAFSLVGGPTWAQKGPPQIRFHGGEVMAHAVVSVYVIWYGLWRGTAYGDRAMGLVADFLQNLGGSPYHNINATYTDRGGKPVSHYLIYGGGVDDFYSHGETLSEADVQGIVADMLASDQLPPDSNGIYLVIGSSDVDAAGLCVAKVERCEFHRDAWLRGVHIKYAFIGYAARCPDVCVPRLNRTTSPNNDVGMDATISWIAHTISGTLTNPAGAGWYTDFKEDGLENSDLCINQFGPTYATANKARANMRLGTRDYLIQQNWVNASPGYCALTYP
jgi:hypothetical protein